MTTAKMTTPEASQAAQAVGIPVHRRVRPLVWARKDQLQHASTRGGLMCAMYPHTDSRADLQPLYDQAALDAAVAAERERWRALLRTPHRMAGGCPDEVAGEDSRDLDCPACRLMQELGA